MEPQVVLPFPSDFPPVTSGSLVLEKGLLLTGHKTGLVVLWDLNKKKYSIIYEASSPVHTISISGKNEVAIGCNSGLLMVFPLDNPKNQTVVQPATYDVHSRVWRIEWTSSDQLVATSTYGVINSFTRVGREWLVAQLRGHSNSVFGIDAFDSDLLATGDYGGRIIVWKKSGNQYEIADNKWMSANVQNLTWLKDGGFAIIHASGRISFFERGAEGEGWRLATQTDTATAAGTCISATEDGKTIIAGTESEVIQFELESQQIARVGLPNPRVLLTRGNEVFAVTDKGLYKFARETIPVRDDLVRYRFAKVSILGHTGVGKSTLCNRIINGTFVDLQSTFGKRIWNWDQGEENSVKNRIILIDHGGQEAVLETFLPFLGDSDMIVVGFKQKDGSTFAKAMDVLREVEVRFGNSMKVIFVQTHTDDPMNVIDQGQIRRLIEEGRIVDCIPVSSKDGSGIKQLEDRLLGEVNWQRAKIMIEAKDVDDLTTAVVQLQGTGTSIVNLDTIKQKYEETAGAVITKHHLRFLLSNLSSQGIVEYYPDALDAVILNDEKFNELKTNIPILVSQKGGLIQSKELEAAFGDRVDYVRVLDELYTKTGVSIRNFDLRIFPLSLKRGGINIVDPYKGFLLNPSYTAKTLFAPHESNISRLIDALGEMGLKCQDLSQSEGLFSWDTGACLYYEITEIGDSLKGRFTQFTYYIGGSVEQTSKRLFGEFSSLIEKLYGPSVPDPQTLKKNKPSEFEFDVAFTFASEQREYVKKVAEILKAKGVKVFFDEFEEAHLWGRDLVARFQEVYSVQSRRCMMFISEAYVSKAWPSAERQFALERQLKEHENYILPVRFDDSKVPGLTTNIGEIDARKRSPAEVAQRFLEMSSLG